MMRIARLNQMEVEVDVNENDIVNVSLDDEVDIEVDAYPNRIFEGKVTEIANSADISGTGSAEQITNYKVKIRISTPHNLDSGPEDYIVQVNEPETPTRTESPNFKPGMSGTVDIRTNTVVDVVSVPIQAVTVRNFAEDEDIESDTETADSDSTSQSDETTEALRTNRSSQEEDFRKVVFLNDNGVAKRVEVETGISDNTHIQILSGVREGDEIVTGNYRILSLELQKGDKIKVNNNSESEEA